MEDLTYTELTAETLTARSLDGFVRRQVVEECWRRVDGALVLRPVAYVEDWTLADRRTRAEEMLEGVRQGARVFAALDGKAVVGFAYLKPEPFGSRGQYRELGRFYVSEPCRGRGVGRRLFAMACEGAREMGAEKLYLSAHSAREPMAVYRRLGCVEAEELNQRLVEKEPCDVQMEFRL